MYDFFNQPAFESQGLCSIIATFRMSDIVTGEAEIPVGKNQTQNSALFD